MAPPTLALLEFLAEFEDDSGEWLDPTTLDEMMQNNPQAKNEQGRRQPGEHRQHSTDETENEHDGQD